ncbi:fimbrial protein [Brenneria populi]|uniref:Fimbrial protein n=1 Tax=Brenneria populi TaxID=1505588 RepID=A0ABU6JMN8_9GAMM|nr:fimbrial protein [Brenneria populi Li et al. 2015]
MKQLVKKIFVAARGNALWITLAAGALGLPQVGWAVQCSTVSGSPTTYNFTYSIASSQNYTGYATGWKDETASGSSSIGGACKGGPDTYFTAKVGPSLTFAVSEGDTQWYDIAGNDYLQVASQIAINNVNLGQLQYHNVPFTDVNNYCNGRCGATLASGSRVRVNFRIKRPFVGITNIASIPIFYLYANQGGTGQGTGSPLAQGYLSGSVTVPQSCELNAGQIISIDFGSVSTGAFKTAGQKAEGVTPVSRSIGIQCKGIEAQASLSLRVQADTVKDNMIVSDNADVGFVIADSDNNPLTPNSLSSVIPFVLDDAASANVSIYAYPVSVTGQTPKVGLATGKGYLRVDFY